MARDTHAAIEDLRQQAGALDSRDITWEQFFALPQAEQIRCARFDLARARRKFEKLLERARKENNVRHIRICQNSLTELVAGEATLNKIASAGG
jgi:hypothetical protein